MMTIPRYAQVYLSLPTLTSKVMIMTKIKWNKNHTELPEKGFEDNKISQLNTNKSSNVVLCSLHQRNRTLISDASSNCPKPAKSITPLGQAPGAQSKDPAGEVIIRLRIM